MVSCRTGWAIALVVTEDLDTNDPSGGETPVELQDVIADLRSTFLVAPDEEVTSRHLAAMRKEAGVTAPRKFSSSPRSRRRRSLVAVGVGGGLVLATGGLAAAGVLPGPLQGTVAAVAHPFGIQLPSGDSAPGTDRTPADQNGGGGPSAGTPTSVPPTDPWQSAPGQGGTNPGRSDEAPGQQDDPGSSDSAPGHGGDNPGQSDQAPGHGGDNLGQSEEAPGHNPTTTNPSVTAPGRSKDSPPTTAPTSPTTARSTPPTTPHANPKGQGSDGNPGDSGAPPTGKGK